MHYPWKNKKTLCFFISVLLLTSSILLLPTTQADTPPPANFVLKWSVNLDSYYPIGWGPNPTDYCYSSNVPPVAADIDNDGYKEIFLCIGYDHDVRNPPLVQDEGTIYALSSRTGVPFWTYHCDDFGSHTVLSLHDLDGDGDLELLANGYHNITAFHAENGAVLWNHHYPTNREDKPALVINENGNIWVYTTQNRYNTYQKTIQKRWGSNGSIAKEAPFPGPIHPCHGGLSCADINNDGNLEIISVDRNYGVNHQGLSCWTLDLTRLWSHPGIACSTSCGVLVDVNHDGYLDVVVETASDGLYVINGDDGTIQKKGTGLGFSSGEIYTPAVYDIDGDGRYEVIAANSGYAKVFDLGTWSMEATLRRWDGLPFWRSPVIANVYGDAGMEMVFGTYGGIQLMGGTHGSYQVLALQSNIRTASDRMLIQDIDNDGRNEIIALAHGTGYGYGSYNLVTCYDTPGVASPGTSSKDFLYTYRRIAAAEDIPHYDPDVQSPGFSFTVQTIGQGRVTKTPNKTLYAAGDVVTLSARADPGWVFTRWTGDVSSSQDSTTVTVQKNTVVTALFTQLEYSLSVDVSGIGTVTKTLQQPTYHYGDVLHLQAVPAPGWSFAGWSGDLSGDANPAALTITKNTLVTALFTQTEYQLTLHAGRGGTIVALPAPPYHEGDVVQLTATPSEGFVFNGWSGNSTGLTNPIIVTMDGSKTVTAAFTPLGLLLDVTCLGEGSVLRSPEKPVYSKNDIVQMTAIPAPGWLFTGWDDPLLGLTNPITITLTDHTLVTARFTPQECTLSFDSIGEGTVLATPLQAIYHFGETVQLTAVPALGWSFTSWDDPLLGTMNPATLTITANQTITATFTQNEYTLTIPEDDGGTITITPEGPYHYGDVVLLTANTKVGYTFAGWNGDVTSTSNPVTLTMDADKTVTALFTPIEYTLDIPITGSGTVIRIPNKPTYHYHDRVQLFAIPDTRWKFTGWNDHPSEGLNPTAILISGNATITATFSFVNNPCIITADPTGPVVQSAKSLSGYRVTATDPEDDTVFYLWDWGDGSTSGWLGPYESGYPVYAEHRWLTDGVYHLSVKAKDSFDAESDWSTPTTVYMTQPMILLGLIRNLDSTNDVSCFNARLLIALQLHPLKLRVFYSGETLLVSKEYQGMIGPRGIIGLFQAIPP